MSSFKPRFGASLAVTILVVAAVFGAGALLVVGAANWWTPESQGEQPLLAEVTLESFVHDVLDQGEVESSNNVEVKCLVKSRNSGGTEIIWIIDEGETVVEGEKILQLDSSAIRRRTRSAANFVQHQFGNKGSSQKHLRGSADCSQGVPRRRFRTRENARFRARFSWQKKTNVAQSSTLDTVSDWQRKVMLPPYNLRQIDSR